MRKDRLIVHLMVVLFTVVLGGFAACRAGYVEPGYGYYYDYDGIAGDEEGISPREFHKHFSHAGRDAFRHADRDGNGFIDRREWHEFQQQPGWRGDLGYGEEGRGYGGEEGREFHGDEDMGFGGERGGEEGGERGGDEGGERGGDRD